MNVGLVHFWRYLLDQSVLDDHTKAVTVKIGLPKLQTATGRKRTPHAQTIARWLACTCPVIILVLQSVHAHAMSNLLF